MRQEWVRWHQKEAVMAAQRAQKEREARVLLKSLASTRGTPHSHSVLLGPTSLRHFGGGCRPRIQAVNAAKSHLANLVPNAVEDLKEVAFPDSRGLAIQRRLRYWPWR